MRSSFRAFFVRVAWLASANVGCAVHVPGVAFVKLLMGACALWMWTCGCVLNDCTDWSD